MMQTLSVDYEELLRDLCIGSAQILPCEMSLRRYIRGSQNGRSVILMMFPIVDDVARHDFKKFISVAEFLAQHNVRVPHIYSYDKTLCYAVLEDLGCHTFGDLQRALSSDDDGYGLYKDAVLMLKELAALPHNPDIPSYTDCLVRSKYDFFVRYYVAYCRADRMTDDVIADFNTMFKGLEKTLPPYDAGFVHSDYHLENLMAVGSETKTAEMALIDFQDAFSGHLSYDLVNLLEDARVSVPRYIQEDMLDLYCADMSAQQRQDFMQWYRVLGTLWHCRVLGYFVRFAAELGRDEYLIHVPRLQAYVRDALRDPVLAPLKTWCDKLGLDFEAVTPLDGDHIRAVFASFNA